MAHSSFSFRRIPAQTIKGASEFLHQHDRMNAIVPAVERLIALQKDCAAILPNASFDVMHWEAGQLILGAPSAAFAARLKQQLPQLQNGLVKRGWQVNAIRIKVQVSRPSEKASASKQISMSREALKAFAELDKSLGKESRDTPLRNAVAGLL